MYSNTRSLSRARISEIKQLYHLSVALGTRLITEGGAAITDNAIAVETQSLISQLLQPTTAYSVRLKSARGDGQRPLSLSLCVCRQTEHWTLSMQPTNTPQHRHYTARQRATLRLNLGSYSGCCTKVLSFFPTVYDTPYLQSTDKPVPKHDASQNSEGLQLEAQRAENRSWRVGSSRGGAGLPLSPELRMASPDTLLANSRSVVSVLCGTGYTRRGGG